MKYRFSLLYLTIVCLLAQLTNSLCLFCEEVKNQNSSKYNSFELVQDIHNFLKFNQRQSYTGHNTRELPEEIAKSNQIDKNETEDLIDLKPEVNEPVVTIEDELIESVYPITEDEPQEYPIVYEMDNPENQYPDEIFADSIQNESTAYYQDLIDLKPEVSEPVVTVEDELIESEYPIAEGEPLENLITYENDTQEYQHPDEIFADSIQNESTAYYQDLIDLKPEVSEPVVTIEDELIKSEYPIAEDEPQEYPIVYEIDKPENQYPDEIFADSIQSVPTAYCQDFISLKPEVSEPVVTVEDELIESEYPIAENEPIEKFQVYNDEIVSSNPDKDNKHGETSSNVEKFSEIEPEEEVTERTYLDDFYVYEIESSEAVTSQKVRKKSIKGKKLVYKNDIFKIEPKIQERKESAVEEFVIFENQRHLEPIKTDEKNSALSIAGMSANLGLELGINAYQVVLDPRHKTGLYAEVNFPVVKIWKKLGDRFEKNEILIQLEDSVPQSNYDRAVAQLDQAFAKFEATSELYKDNLSSLFELKETEAEIAKSKAELTLAERNLHATQIVAPYNGIIDTVYIEEHELPSNGKELIKVIDDEVLIARLLVPSRLLPMIRVGLPFIIHISETDEQIKARISRIGGMIDPASSTMKIEAEIENHEKKFKAGMSGIATFDTREIYRNFN